MDLSTVENKIKQGQYQDYQEFKNDVKLIWSNSFTYNKKGSNISNLTLEISSYFDKISKELE